MSEITGGRRMVTRISKSAYQPTAIFKYLRKVYSEGKKSASTYKKIFSASTYTSEKKDESK